MIKILTLGLVFVLTLGFAITYTNNLTHADEGGKVTDRVCTMQIDKDKAETLTKDGYTYYFCSNHCKATFIKDPAKYACICPSSSGRCNCGHCKGSDESCRCGAEAAEHIESHSEGHEHEQDEGGGHHH